ncbi:hypothetical protein P0D72_13000 [Paraburkholderia sediminicola]|jgi:hypothetical protein|uniref:hypothetical protein n=2 Tax=Paraburkholderia sediminicola TaxID=458836 RepID=UPI0038B6B529
MAGGTACRDIVECELQVDSRRFVAVIVILFRESMNRVLLIVLMLGAGLAGCANDPSGHHGGPPPKDPVDYHGVPTDDHPPVMAPAP